MVTATTVNSGFVHSIEVFLAQYTDSADRCVKKPLSTAGLAESTF